MHFALKINKILSITLFSFILHSFNLFSIQNPNKILSEEEVYKNKIDSLKFKYIHNECIYLCKKASFKFPENQYFNEVLCDEYVKIRKWDKVIEYGERFNRLSYSKFQNYNALFEAYCMKLNWNKAITLSENLIKKNININQAKSNITNLKIKLFISYSGVFVLLLMLVFSFFKIKKLKIKLFKEETIYNYFLVGSFLTLNLYGAFFIFSNFIWSLNPRLPIEDYTLYGRYFIDEHDGIESFLLYSFTLVVIFLSFISVKKILVIKDIYTSYIFGSVLSIAFFLFVIKVGFFPPLMAVKTDHFLQLIIFIVILLGLTYILISSQGKVLYWPIYIFLIGLICFKAIGPLSNLDTSFMFMPALQIVNGDSLKDIYMQYDLLIPFITAVWMKLNLDLNLIQLFFQFTFFLFFLVLFYFFNKFFINKKLAVFAIISIILLRYYGLSQEPSACLQNTPLRLEMWLILLILVYFKGVYHWSIGICLGLFLIFHKNLGLIYVASYFELLFTLFLVEIFELSSQKHLFLNALKISFYNKIRQTWIILISILISVIIVIILFGSFTPESAILYQKIGIGMIPITKNSLFWYVPILYTVSFGLIIKLKSKLDIKYYHTALFIIFLSIGNCMYFFGRSHEVNLICVSPLIILLIFVCFDLRKLNNLSDEIIGYKKYFKNALPYFLISFIFILYSRTISNRIFAQLDNYKKNRITYSLLNVPTQKDFSSIKTLTHNSKKVYFIFCGIKYPWEDFFFYYYGNYKPIGHYNPSMAYIFKKDYAVFLNELLSKDYYLVTRDKEYMEELLLLMHYTKMDTLKGYTAISNFKSKSK